MPDMRQVEAVIIRVQQGEQESFAFIVDAFQQPVYRYCCRMLGNRQDAEDAVQDVLVKAYQSISGYKPTVSFSAWLYRIAGNHCLNLLRRRRMQGHFLRVFRPDTAAAAGPEQTMEERLYSPALEAALGRLSLEERNLLVLRVFEEQTFLEISAILNITPNALHKRMERIKRKVRETMQAEEGISWNGQESAMSTKI
jgi:RNA polymerase sigma factor (sigma-70 family)